MSSTVSLQNLLTVNNPSPKSPSPQMTSSEEFSDAVATATSEDSSSESSSLISPQTNTALQTRLLAEQTEAAIEVFAIRPQESPLTLESVLALEADASPNTAQTMPSAYNQTNLDIVGLERSFLELIQAVQKEDIPQVRKILGQLSRRRPRAKYSSLKKGEGASDPLEKFVEEMKSALDLNDLYAAQLTINLFLAHLGESRGSFVITSA